MTASSTSTTTSTTSTTSTAAFPPDQHAIVQIMGHVTLAGRISEVSFAGTVLLRVDVPQIPATPASERPATAHEVYRYGPGREFDETLTGRMIRGASPGRPGYTKCYGGSAIYSIEPCTAEEALLDEMKRWDGRPREQFKLDEGQEVSAALLPPPDDEDDDEHDEQPF